MSNAGDSYVHHIFNNPPYAYEWDEFKDPAAGWSAPSGNNMLVGNFSYYPKPKSGSFYVNASPLIFEMDLDRPHLARMAMRAMNLSSEQFRVFPGATNLNADLVIGNNKLTARVFGEAISLDFGNFFRVYLVVTIINGSTNMLYFLFVNR